MGNVQEQLPQLYLQKEFQHLDLGNHEGIRETPQECSGVLCIVSAQVFSDSNWILSDIEGIKEIGGCTIVWQI